MIIFAAIQIPVMLAIAFFFATIFDLGVAKYGTFFRTIFFIPFAVPAVVGAVMWSFLLEPQFGPFVHFANGIGLPAEPRKFVPHVTLARLRGAPRDRVITFLAAHALYSSAAFDIGALILYSSILSPNGSLYRPERAYALE